MMAKPKNSSAIPRGASATCFAMVAIAFLFFGLRGHSAPRLEPAEGLRGQSNEEAQPKSAGCISCHSPMDEATMHPTKTVQLGCTDCHGGNSSAAIASGTTANSPEYLAEKQKAHVQPRDPVFRNRGVAPQNAFTMWLKESAEYVKFVNPGDLRVAAET